MLKVEQNPHPIKNSLSSHESLVGLPSAWVKVSAKVMCLLIFVPELNRDFGEPEN